MGRGGKVRKLNHAQRNKKRERERERVYTQKPGEPVARKILGIENSNAKHALETFRDIGPSSGVGSGSSGHGIVEVFFFFWVVKAREKNQKKTRVNSELFIGRPPPRSHNPFSGGIRVGVQGRGTASHFGSLETF